MAHSGPWRSEAPATGARHWQPLRRWLAHRHRQLVWALFVLANGFLTVGLLAALAMITGTPFVFPSVGPTAFLFFFNPHSPSAAPRNAIVGHAIGLVCGYGALAAFGLIHAGSALQEGVDSRRVLAAALSLAATGALMVLLRAAHPPAGATTLIVSLGLITRPSQLVVLECAVAVLALQAIVINRLAGLDFPLWRHHPAHDQIPTPPGHSWEEQLPERRDPDR